jgi:branched-chain amino acid transport system substrate-binding protein
MNATAIALSMKTAGVDSTYFSLQTSDSLNLLVAVKQAGLQLKVPFIATGYGQDFLNQPAAVQAGQGAYFLAFQRPIEEHTPATIAQEAALNKAGWAGDPSINVTYGWMNADLAIAGMEAAGPNPTKASVISAVRNKVTNWNGGGLEATTRDFSLKDFGVSPKQQCDFYLQLKGTTYTPVPASGAPTCGTKTD